jgi:hypothetical protein
MSENSNVSLSFEAKNRRTTFKEAGIFGMKTHVRISNVGCAFLLI